MNQRELICTPTADSGFMAAPARNAIGVSLWVEQTNKCRKCSIPIVVMTSPRRVVKAQGDHHRVQNKERSHNRFAENFERQRRIPNVTARLKLH